METTLIKWVLMVFVSGSMPASVGHFSTREGCVEAITKVRIPDLDLQGRVEEFASLNSKRMTMFCTPVERLAQQATERARD